MATIVPHGQLAKYPCDTQEEDDPSFGHAPLSNLAGTTGDNAPGEPDDLVLGFGTIVPRWDTRASEGTKLQYYVQTEGFPSTDQARNAAATFQKAADSWNELKTGVTILQTTDLASANFYLVYKTNPTSGPGTNTLARAFFPHEIGQDVVVFQRGLEPSYKSILNNVFQHEIGHILGLRHEFAITGDESKRLRAEGNGAVQFMEMNYDSIMSYNMPPRIQDSDREQVVKFYQMPNGFMRLFPVLEDGDDNHRHEQNSTKKRKALHDVDDTDARLNSAGASSKAPKIDAQARASASRPTAQLSIQASQNTRPESRLSGRRAVIKDWPQIQEVDAFTNASVGEQRAEIKRYMRDLQEYARAIQAGTIPTHFVAKFFRRLGTHFQHLDNARDRLIALQSKQVAREAQILALIQESTADSKEEADLYNSMIEDIVQESQD
ncbi:hypothetical protein LTR64_004973 [Lithohypha guttulata]|uniref:uncharacterized protein n=1 Tax=Lithohypha guttulata TaxID=1690604 RepID=UPI002DE1B050|nr:hypothetical protein LTR51_005191 [Lithohypha guttulata]